MIKYLQKLFSKLLLVLFSLLVAGSYNFSTAQVSFTTVCPKKKIGKNDYLQIQFKVEHASSVESIDPPSFTNFSIVSGPNQESGMTVINGKSDQYVSIGYVLKPNGPGNYTIGSATAKADGKELRSDPLNIQVTNSSSPSPSSPAGNSVAGLFPTFPNLSFDFPDAPRTNQFDDYILKKGENVEEKIKRNLFIKLDISKTSCYVGEPIVAAYKLYTRLRSESTITDAPSFNGFSVNDLALNNNSSGVEKYNGRDYNVYILRKVELYPLQAGTFTLDPLVADNKVTFLKGDYAASQGNDMLLNMMQNFDNDASPDNSVVQKDVTLKSKPVIITVKPLPEDNKPADFKGYVGKFEIESSLQKNDITTDDAGNLKITISGEGNIQMVNAPKINWPQGIDGYDAKITDGIDKSAVPMKGTKSFTYPFTVSAAGTFTIPPVSYSYFDPETGNYKILTTQPLTISVTKGKGIPTSSYAMAGISKNSKEKGLLEKNGLYFLSGVLFTALILVFIGRRKISNKNNIAEKNTVVTEKEHSVKEKEPEFIIPDNLLEEAHEKLIEGKSSAFFAVLDSSLKKYLSMKFKVPAEELTKKRINEELDKCNVGLGTSIRLSNLMETIELNLYAPSSPINQQKEVYEKAAEVISLLNKQC